MTSPVDKKKKLLLQKYIESILEEGLDHPPLHTLYKRSKAHPEEVYKQNLLKQQTKQKSLWRQLLGFHKNNDVSNAPKVSHYGSDLILSPELQEYILKYLQLYLPGNLVAQKLLSKSLISKQEASSLAQVLISDPKFIIKQPRKLIQILILMANENSFK